MSGQLRAVDLRFLLPVWPTGLAVHGLGERAAAAVAAAGHPPHGPAGAALCAPDLLTAALRGGVPPSGVVVVGAGARAAVRRAGLRGRTWSLVPGEVGTALAVPAGAPSAGRAALLEWAGTQTRVKRVRNRLAEAALRTGAVPPRTVPAVVVGPDDGWPALSRVLAPDAPGAPAFLGFPGSDDLSRVVAVVPEERVVVKATRSPQATRAHGDDARGLALAAAVPAAAERAPRLLAQGRLSTPAVPWSAESRGAGSSLTAWLQSSPRDGLRVLRDIAGWLLAVAQQSAGPVDDELARLARDVLPASRVEVDLGCLGAAPGVLQHGDLGAWNVVTDGRGFTVLDWEAARSGALPVWDLLYLLTDGLAALDGARSVEERLQHAVRLHRGELPASSVLFHEVARATRAAALPLHAAGALGLTCWLHHGLSTARRHGERIGEGGTSSSETVPVAGRLGEAWCDDPLLGTRWRAFSDAVAP